MTGRAFRKYPPPETPRPPVPRPKGGPKKYSSQTKGQARTQTPKSPSEPGGRHAPKRIGVPQSLPLLQSLPVARSFVPTYHPFPTRNSIELRAMKIVVPILLIVLSAPVVSASDGTWTHTHNYKWWHVPIPGHEARVIKTRNA